MEIRLGYGPDVDDAFIFYALATGKVDTGDHTVEPAIADIQTLNDRASRGELEVTASSAGAYPYVRDSYVLARCGGSFGTASGPKIVSRLEMTADDLAEATVAVPGITTSAYLALQLLRPGLRTMVLPFDKIISAVGAGVVDCGLMVHGWQLAWETHGLHVVVDLAESWSQKAGGLPLPLSCGLIRKDVPPEVRKELQAMVRASVQYGLAHREQALRYAMEQSSQSLPDQAEQFVCTYVNDMTVDMGERGVRALEEFLRQGEQAGVIPSALPLEFA